MESTELMIYNKENNNYIVLVTGDGLVDEVNYDWEKLKKTVVDIKIYPKNQELCWYLYKEIKKDSVDINGFGIGKNLNQTKIINEHFDCELYEKYKIFDVDYDRGKIIEINEKESTFCCSDGY